MDEHSSEAFAAARQNLLGFLSRPFLVLVLDTETTGLEAHDQVIQVSVLSGTGEVLFDSLVRPTVAVHPEAARVSGLRDEQLLSAPPWSVVWPQLQSVLRG
jgi:DNA polymerase-3 subunit epsilon